MALFFRRSTIEPTHEVQMANLDVILDEEQFANIDIGLVHSSLVSVPRTSARKPYLYPEPRYPSCSAYASTK